MEKGQGRSPGACSLKPTLARSRPAPGKETEGGTVPAPCAQKQVPAGAVPAPSCLGALLDFERAQSLSPVWHWTSDITSLFLTDSLVESPPPGRCSVPDTGRAHSGPAMNRTPVPILQSKTQTSESNNIPVTKYSLGGSRGDVGDPLWVTKCRHR